MSPFKQDNAEVLASPSLLLPLLICETCAVRRPCLRAALDPPAFNVRDDAKLVRPRVIGSWGGTHEGDRYQVAALPIDEGIDELERTFPARVEARIAAYREGRAKVRPYRGTGNLRPRNPTLRDRRIDELLAKRQVKTSHVIGAGAAGPGRGHKGPITLYAERHGVSRATAWRRLRAAA